MFDINLSEYGHDTFIMMAILHMVFLVPHLSLPPGLWFLSPVDQVKALEKVCTDLVTGAKAKDHGWHVHGVLTVIWRKVLPFRKSLN